MLNIRSIDHNFFQTSNLKAVVLTFEKNDMKGLELLLRVVIPRVSPQSRSRLESQPSSYEISGFSLLELATLVGSEKCHSMLLEKDSNADAKHSAVVSPSASKNRLFRGGKVVGKLRDDLDFSKVIVNGMPIIKYLCEIGDFAHAEYLYNLDPEKHKDLFTGSEYTVYQESEQKPYKITLASDFREFETLLSDSKPIAKENKEKIEGLLNRLSNPADVQRLLKLAFQASDLEYVAIILALYDNIPIGPQVLQGLAKQFMDESIDIKQVDGRVISIAGTKVNYKKNDEFLSVADKFNIIRGFPGDKKPVPVCESSLSVAVGDVLLSPSASGQNQSTTENVSKSASSFSQSKSILFAAAIMHPTATTQPTSELPANELLMLASYAMATF